MSESADACAQSMLCWQATSGRWALCCQNNWLSPATENTGLRGALKIEAVTAEIRRRGSQQSCRHR